MQNWIVPYFFLSYTHVYLHKKQQKGKHFPVKDVYELLLLDILKSPTVFLIKW